MKVDVLLGLQWGDEGKGKVVDVLTPKYDIIARFQGGPNAGHSLEFNNIKHVLHLIPSGVFHENKLNIIGNGVVLDPIVFVKEYNELIKLGVDLKKNLVISKKTHLILPTHRTLDAASEAAKGATKIGSTLRGIGPTYMDKTGRNGLRVGDTLLPDFKERYNSLKAKHAEILKQYNFEYNIDEQEKEWLASIEVLKQFKLVDSEHIVNNAIKKNQTILAEGAQGTLLDIDFGSYPYVTSSNTICAGACTGLGVAPRSIGEVFGIVKAYCTRVGSGPFPTEQINAQGEELRKKGCEYGATTGRPRRCGWLDLVALKYSIAINGVTQIILTKSDVLSGMAKIPVCTHYKIDGQLTDEFPYSIENGLEPVYAELDGWNEDITTCKTYDSLPVNLKKYIQFIEKETGVPVSIVSVGPNREQTIVR
ncbi:MAG TPA: adenylosuccinate synthase [Bacteroidales bacterium]|nr:adenylosuccinate synthase [Bacteroidales bacterium]